MDQALLLRSEMLNIVSAAPTLPADVGKEKKLTFLLGEVVRNRVCV